MILLCIKTKIIFAVIAIQSLQDFFSEYKMEFLSGFYDYAVNVLNLSIGTIVAFSFHKSKFHMIPHADQLGEIIDTLKSYIPKEVDLIL